MRGNKNDQLVAPAPAVTFETDAAAEQVLTNVRTQHDQALVFAAAQSTQAGQCQEDIDTWGREIGVRQREIAERQHEIAERESWIEQRSHAKRQFEDQATHGLNVAKGAAGLLAAAGVTVPPPNGELSYNPEGVVARWSDAVDEDRAAQPERAL